MAVAMTMLDAVVHVQGPDGPRTVEITELYRLPGAEPGRDTTLGRADLITGVELPPPGLARARPTGRSVTGPRLRSAWPRSRRPWSWPTG